MAGLYFLSHAERLGFSLQRHRNRMNESSAKYESEGRNSSNGVNRLPHRLQVCTAAAPEQSRVEQEKKINVGLHG